MKNGSSGVGLGVGAAVVVLAVSGFCALASVQKGNTLTVLMALAWLIVIATGIAVIANRRAKIPTIEMPAPWSQFGAAVLTPWRSVYHVDPPGLAKAADLSTVADPRPAVLCPDRSVLFCLEANGVPERLKVALVARADHLPVGVPVLVLHDASPAGCLLTQRTRDALPGRQVMDGGVQPRAVAKAPGSIRLRTRPSKQDVQALAETPLDAKEREWLAKGWWSPIGALRPAALAAGTAARPVGGRAPRADDPGPRPGTPRDDQGVAAR